MTKIMIFNLFLLYDQRGREGDPMFGKRIFLGSLDHQGI
jgi:hypothetical protein